MGPFHRRCAIESGRSAGEQCGCTWRAPRPGGASLDRHAGRTWIGASGRAWPRPLPSPVAVFLMAERA